MFSKMQKWLDDHGFLIDSTHNEGKSVANDSKSYFCYWKKLVDEYSNKNLLMLIILL